MRELTPEPLTAEAFAPFGRVIEASDAAVKLDINQGHAVRYDGLAEIDVADQGGSGAISLFRARPLTPQPVTPAKLSGEQCPALFSPVRGTGRPDNGVPPDSQTALVLKSFERHPLGSQSFVPLGGKPYLVAVAPPGEFDPAAIRLFRAAGHQGVHYHKGTWHHFLLVLAESDFLVVDRAGPGANCEEVGLAPADQIMVRP
jgi:ureidoglycolate lyase